MNFSSPKVIPRRVPPPPVSIIVITMATACFLLGLFGNARVFIQLYKRRNLRRVPHYLFANLSAIGMLAMLVNIPSFVLVLTLHYLLDRRVSFRTELVWSIGGTLALAVSILNAATLSLMAIDREDCVLRPFERRLTQQNIRKVLLATWIIASVLTMPSAVLRSQEPYTSQMDPSYSFTNNANTRWRLYIFGVGTVLSVATFLVIAITFYRVIKKLRSSVLPPANAAQQIQQRREYRITTLTYQTCGVFLVAWLPLIIVNTVARVAKCDANVTGIIRLFMIVISNYNYAVNPFLNHRILLTRPQNQESGNSETVG